MKRFKGIWAFIQPSVAFHLHFIEVHIKACLMGLQTHVEKCPSSTPSEAGGDRGGSHKTETNYAQDTFSSKSAIKHNVSLMNLPFRTPFLFLFITIAAGETSHQICLNFIVYATMNNLLWLYTSENVKKIKRELFEGRIEESFSLEKSKENLWWGKVTRHQREILQTDKKQKNSDFKTLPEFPCFVL